MLRRDGLITAWYDREIKAGDVIDEEVNAQLEHCDLFLALVSPDFLNSNYCYDKEMKRAIARHEAGEMRIVPIILEHATGGHRRLSALRLCRVMENQSASGPIPTMPFWM
jgi:hypothetical protein